MHPIESNPRPASPCSRLLRAASPRWLLPLLLPAFVAIGASATDTAFTRGIGVYPGSPADFDGPTLVAETQTYRNLALHRPAYASSNYDYNLTAQLVTDGIIDTHLPHWLITSSSTQGVLPRAQREDIVDHVPWSGVELPATGGWVQLEQAGGAPRAIDRVEVTALPRCDDRKPQVWTCTLLGSTNGTQWTELGRQTGNEVLDGAVYTNPKLVKANFTLPAGSSSRFYRVQIGAPSVQGWLLSEVDTFNAGKSVELGGPYQFTSAWKSAGAGRQWVDVDLGNACTFDRVTLHWIRRAAAGSLQASDDAKSWRTLEPLAANQDDYRLPKATTARYVRVLLDKAATPDGYILSELQVFGRGGPLPVAQSAATPKAGQPENLTRGAWRIQRDSLVKLDGAQLSEPGVDCSAWLPATVPGTALVSYLNAGALPDPNYGDNQLQISDSFFYANFWYRDEFTIPAPAAGKKVWLNFNGINWKADVYFNGAKLGRIDGAFTRARFDVTALVHPGAPNALAVLIHKNAHPGSVHEKTAETTGMNGGQLGADNPTFHASIGWDWIPTVRGRDIGIWSDVSLTTTGPVTIENPFATSSLPLPHTNSADVTVRATLQNHTSTPVSGVLRGHFGDATFERPVVVPPNASLKVTFDPSTTPDLHLVHPRLWWPVGYGKPNLYPVGLAFDTDNGAVSDTTTFHSGVKEFTYAMDHGALKIFINGRRFIGKGGNWGFSESNLLYRAREYNIAVKYHRDMGFTMIRNWVGQVGDDAFYDACDRYGVVVWQDFWLANPYDGPNPDDDAMFLKNASDFILRIRNHASVGLFCGRNEGYPPPTIEKGLRSLIAKDDPEIHYISHSAADGVSGGGPYHLMPINFYFDQRATTHLHSELGMPVIPTMDSLRRMMPSANRWPQGAVWGLHDFTAQGAQVGDALRNIIDKSYGGASNAAEWVELAQFTNYDGYRAMFEAQGKNRMGVLLWMSHPCWPSFVWQTYDYYFDTNAAYFGAKKGCEPLHVQWNPLNDHVEVVNYSAGNRTGLMVKARIVNLDGSVQWAKSTTTDSREDSIVAPITLEFPKTGLSPVHFVELTLVQGSKTISRNTYMRSLKTYEIPGFTRGSYHVPTYPEYDFSAIRSLPKVALRESTTVERKGDHWTLVTTVENATHTPALLVRLKAVGANSGQEILPAFYSDNYLTLLPGEVRIIHTTLNQADTRGEPPRIDVSGFNVAPH